MRGNLTPPCALLERKMRANRRGIADSSVFVAPRETERESEAKGVAEEEKNERERKRRQSRIG